MPGIHTNGQYHSETWAIGSSKFGIVHAGEHIADFNSTIIESFIAAVVKELVKDIRKIASEGSFILKEPRQHKVVVAVNFSVAVEFPL